MESTSTSDSPEAVLADLHQLMHRYQALPAETFTDHEVRALLHGIEQHARTVDAARVALLGHIERSGLHHVDGHASARIMARHTCRLSNPEAARRERIQRALRNLPLVADAYRDGTVGTDQVNLIANVHSNPRVRDALVGFQADLLVLATECAYPDFEAAVREWERLADADGPKPRDDTGHQRRHVSMTQDPQSLDWHLRGSFGALQGAKINDVLRAFADKEWQGDWAEARQEHGDNACAADLARTTAQRAADAFAAMAERAAAAEPGAKEPATEHVIVWSADAYEATAHRVTCTDLRCTAPAHSTNKWYDPATYRCETIDGHKLEPVEALPDSFHHHLRTVLVTNGQPTHVGSRHRLFTGRNRLAVKLQSTTCLWPGCWVPTSACEADHAQAHADGGPTHPHNGAPLCGRHNRWKQKGYKLKRDPDTGRWRTYRPDGTEIE